MRKIISTTICFVLIIASHIFSQEKLHLLQFTGGMGATFITGSKSKLAYIVDTAGAPIPYNVTYSSAPAFLFGILWEPPSRFKRLYMRTGILYERKSYIINPILYYQFNYQNNQITYLKGKEKFDYLVFPLFIKGYLGNSKRFFIEMGSYYSFGLKSSFTFDKAPPTQPNTVVAVSFNSLSMRDLELGISIGAGWLYPVTEKWLISFETKYTCGTTKLNPLYLSTGIARKFVKQ